MRWLWFCAFWLVTAASAQVPVERTRYEPAIAYGAIVPEIATVNVSNSPAGATNATGNNLAGARNSTLGNVPGLSYGSISVPVYLQPFSAGEYPPEFDLAPAPRNAELAGAMRGPSAYSLRADPLAVVARAQRERQRIAGVPFYTNADLQRIAEESENTGQAAVSTVQRTANEAAAAAQAALDRNLGVRTPQ